MQGRHGGVLVAEFVLRPDAAFALSAVDGIDEAEAACFFANGSGDVGIGEETRGHAGPKGEDDKCDQVAHGHGTPTGFVQLRSGGGTVRFACWLVMEGKIEAVPCRGVVEEPNQEENSPRNVYKRVGAVRPV